MILDVLVLGTTLALLLVGFLGFSYLMFGRSNNA